MHDGPLGKTEYYSIPIEFEERGSPHISIRLYEFSMHRMFKIKLVALSLLRKE